MGTERDTVGVGKDMSMPLKLFLVPEVCFPRRLHRLQPQSEVFSEKANFNGSPVFCGYTRGLCSQGTQRTNKS